MGSRVATTALAMIASLMSVAFWFVVSMFVINAIDPPKLGDNEVLVPLITSVEYFTMQKTVVSFVAGIGITVVMWMVVWMTQPTRQTGPVA